jgi:hypothetical protein
MRTADFNPILQEDVAEQRHFSVGFAPLEADGERFR